jgi:glycosyltransferase involved in cell wall biosynthesis
MSNKILFIGNSLKTMLNFRSNIINYFSDNGCNVFVLAPFDTPFQLKNNVTFLEFGSTTRSLSFFDLFNQISSLKKLTKKNSINNNVTIFPYSPKIILLTLLSTFNKNCNIFPFFIGIGSLFLKKRYFFIRLLLGFLIDNYYSVKFVVCLNKSDLHVLRLYIKKKKIIVMRGEGIDSNHYNFLDSGFPSPLRFIIISRPLIEKGVLLFIETVSYFKSNYDFIAEFAIYGFDETNLGSDLPDNFLNECNRLGIKLHGYFHDIQNHIKPHDVLVLPSQREGMSRVCMEMQEYGLPVIGSNVPGIQDIVVNGVTGFLVDELHPRFFVDAMINFCLMSNDEFQNFRARISVTNRSYFLDFEAINFYLALSSQMSSSPD